MIGMRVYYLFAIGCLALGISVYTLCGVILLYEEPVIARVQRNNESWNWFEGGEYVDQQPDDATLQRKRNETIYEVCRRLNNGSSRALNKKERFSLLTHLIVNDAHRILYCYVPKVACSNWKRVMQVLAGKYKKVEDIRAVDHNNVRLLVSYKAEEQEYRLKNYYKFVFVRDPLDRLFSAWHDKLFVGDEVKFTREFGMQMVRELRGSTDPHPTGKDVTFAEFMKYLSLHGTSGFNEHWMRYVDLCQPCHVDYDYVGMYERLDVEAVNVITQLNLSDKVSFPNHRVQDKYKIHATSVQAKIQAWKNIPEAVFKIIVEKFGIDFDLFGYHRPSSIEQHIDDYLTDSAQPGIEDVLRGT